MRRRTIPEGLDTLESGGRFIIRKTWFSMKIIPVLFFCIGWNAFLVFWYVAAFGGFGDSGPVWLAIIFPIAHVAVGVGLSYYVIASFFNKTDLVISPDWVETNTRPIPWKGNAKIRPADIKGVLVRERADGYNKSQYRVMWVDRSMKERPLFLTLEELDQANFIRDELAEILGVENLNE